MSFQSLHFDILISIAQHLCARDLVSFSQTCRTTWSLGKLDHLWKRLCRTDYGLTYNHPDQTYYALYSHTSIRAFGRLPCRHLLTPAADTFFLNPIDTNAKCCGAGVPVEFEKLFICVTCARPLCDRHARSHSDHVVFYKPNMAELFCQHCVDWLGGKDSDPAEQYQVQQQMQAFSRFINADKAMRLKAQRQHERWLRWQDTPIRIVTSPRGFCFVSARFMWEWERFVEGWRTDPPLEEKINHTLTEEETTSSSATQEDRVMSVRFDPFLPEATDLHMVSTETWEYLEQVYRVAGPKISKGAYVLGHDDEDDLLHSEIYRQWKYTMMRYKDRVMLRH